MKPADIIYEMRHKANGIEETLCGRGNDREDVLSKEDFEYLQVNSELLVYYIRWYEKEFGAGTQEDT
jgi:hypothetical protein